jgi:acyl carrier protein
MTEPTDRLKDRVRCLVIEVAPIEAERARTSMTLTDDLGYDSLGMLDLVNVLENEFDLPTIVDGNLVDIETMGDIENLVLHLIAKQQGRRK